MAFPAQIPQSFEEHAVRALNPGQLGVYGLYNSVGWVYIGKGDIRERLLAHLRGDNLLILAYGPTHFVASVTPYLDWEEKRLIAELRPAANQRVG